MKRPLARVLYVDDEPLLRKVTKVALERIGGFTVAVASSGPEALEMATDFKADLILLDVMMPGMDGPTTLAALRERPETKKTPVVFFTAKAQPAEIERLLAHRVAGLITKPFDPPEMIADLVGFWNAAEEPE